MFRDLKVASLKGLLLAKILKLMEEKMNNTVRLFVANGFGFGKYWAGYIFAKTIKDKYFLYLANNRMAILSSSEDEDREKKIIVTSEEFQQKELSVYFNLDYGKISKIDWLQVVNIMLFCKNKMHIRNNLIYYTYPAVNLNFVSDMQANTIIVYDRFVSKHLLEKLKDNITLKDLIGKVEFWSMLKLLAMGDRFGELAPKICMESIPIIRNRLI